MSKAKGRGVRARSLSWRLPFLMENGDNDKLPLLATLTKDRVPTVMHCYEQASDPEGICALTVGIPEDCLSSALTSYHHLIIPPTDGKIKSDLGQVVGVCTLE
jgi:hypothetical protein